MSESVEQLRRAIEKNDVVRVKALMSHNPELHRAPLGYAQDGPLTLAAQSPGNPTAIARWMIENGSDVHQGGDAPLMRAALSHHRIPMMELLVAYGADVNAEWHGEYPIIFAPCETVDPLSLQWLLEHGANPNCDNPQRKHSGTALDYVIGSYVRSPALSACIDLLLHAGGATRFNIPAVLAILSGHTDRLREHLNHERELLTRQFPELDFGTTGGRLLTLRGATLLHVAAEYRNVDAAILLLDRGANVNAIATIDRAGVGGQTAVFHAATQFNDGGLPLLRLLVERGADLTIRAKLPGHYERPGEIIECTPLGYATLFKNETHRGDKAQTIAYLRSQGAPE